ncbi:pyrroloquinoline quinone biosynthesis protein PqqE [Carboxydochorda subterranea]|uniref:PqqA peptide cyclase n=1 Tax=Carboxydichorda subterranea TaxID=3109565 RepID=A0ABZ1BXH3_9FIRM|nr:pyrroloquinoline quinone biosynthesis protein PqqE [Limnochorda sp. L945t]WRP17477.1 pyrroloquinoline quinone biosynthesis protein PqqE [Limnochorda sp. L945t]
MGAAGVMAGARTPRPVAPPMAMLAELTHRCPLQCVYCSNPVQLVARSAELDTRAWARIFRQAARLGVLQLHLSGGEPLLRRDLAELVRVASEEGLYTNLITSGVGLSQRRVGELKDAGLGAVQLSFQAADPSLAREIAGGEFWEEKVAAATLVREAGLPLSLNVVLHRHNLGQVRELMEMADALGAERLELANTQFYGWALANRAFLMPDRATLERAEREVDAFRARGSSLEILWVIPDYHEGRPKPCMGGWGRLQLTVAPDGRALPCPVAYVLPGLDPPLATEATLDWIWYDSPAFQRFRGFDWMQEPCRSCARRFEDFGGCRCQAFLLTGDPEATDPACAFSPHHERVVAATSPHRGLDAASPRPSPASSPRPAKPLYRTYPGPGKAGAFS